jgi:catechol 2,3-dioxygenase-like lactoylglutathione lyase family enzyme
MSYNISGIQQIGIGVTDAEAAWAWYRKQFNMDVPVFRDTATANLMTRYTGNEAQDRYAILAMNMSGGGGFEIWQYTSREPQHATFDIMLGDTGVLAIKMKSRDIDATYQRLKNNGVNILNGIELSPCGKKHFYLKDPYNNLFEIIEGKSWFKKQKREMGGVAGCVIGVTDIDNALMLYANVLGYDQILSDETGSFKDIKGLPGGRDEYRRVILGANPLRKGAFCRLFGHTEIELLEVKSRAARKSFDNRYWGDLGYIHVCFDVHGMNQLSERCKREGFPFTVDSNNSFDMGKAAGHFTYCEDPDGTLIEFVETHKIPIIEKLGWYLNLKKRNTDKPLPDWMLGMLSLNRVKD